MYVAPRVKSDNLRRTCACIPANEVRGLSLLEISRFMKLVPCPKCRKLCPPETASCEHCGCPVRAIIEQRNKQATWIIAIVGLSFLLLLAITIIAASRM